MEKRALIFDFGASSGRAMLVSCTNGRLSLQEIHRFSNDPVSVQGTLYWDILRLFHEVKRGILRAKQAGGFDCIGVDTWGADFGLLGQDGALLENPIHCRDVRTNGVPEQLFTHIPAEALYARTGIQFNQFNTIYQLYSLRLQRPDVLERAHRVLLMADLMTYLLTGIATAEYTLATTSQLIDPATGTWNLPLLEQLGLPARLFPPVVQPGSVVGTLSPALCQELDVPPKPVYASCGHDTACAVASVPAEDGEFAYISSGTWSLLGAEVPAPMITEQSRAYNFTNEGGYGGTTRLLTNIIGLWLIQESRRQWQREGETYSFGDLEQLARESAPFVSYIDPNAPAFAFPGNLPLAVQTFCRQTGQPVPQSVGEIMRCIYESLALTYQCALSHLEEITAHHYPCLHIVGGGSKDSLLCQMAADACARPVLAGPSEASSIGNGLVCLMADGGITSLQQARSIVTASFPIATYLPQETAAWAQARQRYQQVCGGTK